MKRAIGIRQLESDSIDVDKGIIIQNGRGFIYCSDLNPGSRFKGTLYVDRQTNRRTD